MAVTGRYHDKDNQAGNHCIEALHSGVFFSVVSLICASEVIGGAANLHGIDRL